MSSHVHLKAIDQPSELVPNTKYIYLYKGFKEGDYPAEDSWTRVTFLNEQGSYFYFSFDLEPSHVIKLTPKQVQAFIRQVHL